jgi:hypothetical protein
MGGTCNMHSREEKCIENFESENLKGRSRFEDTGVYRGQYQNVPTKKYIYQNVSQRSRDIQMYLKEVEISKCISKK